MLGGVKMAKLGGHCPLDCVEDPKKFMKRELERYHGKSIEELKIPNENLKEEYCKGPCPNFLC